MVNKIPAVKKTSGMEEKIEGLRKQFERMALEYIRRLEKRQVVLGIRTVSKSWDDVKEYLWLSRPRTGIRYGYLFERFLDFASSSAELSEMSIEDDALVAKWLQSLVREKVGANTPKCALLSIEFFGRILGFRNPANDNRFCKKLVHDFGERQRREPKRAKAYSKKFMDWLERTVCNQGVARIDRLVCGRLRLCIGGSVRHDDMCNTPVGRCEWIRNEGASQARGMRTMAAVTKIAARHWVVSFM